VVDLAKKFEDWGVESIVYTDIGRDGMLTGINIEATVKLAQALTIPVIASGGLGSMRDIENLCAVEHEGIEGVICGRAIYRATSTLLLRRRAPMRSKHPPEALRAFPPLSQRCALRAGGRHRCGGAALARWPLVWAAPIACLAFVPIGVHVAQGPQ
jgi:tRNA-dihydrouridine synthase